VAGDEIAQLRARLDEVEEALAAVRAGEFRRGGLDESASSSMRASVEHPFRLMIERMAEGAVTLAIDDGRILYCNRAFGRMLGRTPDSLIGRRIAELLAPRDEDVVSALWRELDDHRDDYEVLGPDGRRVPVSISAATVEVASGPTRCLVIADLTARRDVERLREARAQLETTARRKDEFIAMLGHELRNPLAPIRHAAELLGSRGLDGHELDAVRSTIIRQVGHMRRLVDDLLDMGRITRGTLAIEPRWIDLREAVQLGVEATLELSPPRRHVVDLTIPGERLDAHVDPVRIAQVVTNLLSNAAKFTPPGGRIQLELERREDQAVITVSDEGAGIEADMLSAIFEVFVQGEVTIDRTTGGLGLGLALVKRIVELHGGRVVAASDGRGRGSRFVVVLPHAIAPADTPAQSRIRRRPSGPGRGDTMRLPAANEQPAMGRLLRTERARMRAAARATAPRVLVCDDNVDVADMLALVLRKRGFDVDVAHSGRDALALVQLHRHGVVFLDLGLPDIDGFEVARRLRSDEHGRTAVIAAVTGYGQDSDRRAAIAAGCDFHLVKPVPPERLDEVLASHPLRRQA